jgi:hypothetical protein
MFGAFKLTQLNVPAAPASGGWIAETTVGFKPAEVVADSSGYVYVAGRVAGADGTYLWVYSPSGAIQTSKKLALTASEATGVRLDSSNNVYICGHYNTSGSNYRIVVAKYLASSFTLDWQKYFDLNTSTGATGTELSYDMAIHTDGAIYVTGQTPSFSSTTPAAFIVRMDSTASTMNWYRTYTLTSSAVDCTNIDIDSAGQVIVSGSLYPTSTGVQVQWSAMLNGGVTGGGAVYQSRLGVGSTVSCAFNDQCLDSSNNIIQVGKYNNTTNPNAGYLIKRTSTFTISWQVAIDFTAGQMIFDSVTTDTSGNIYVSGWVNVASSKIHILKYNSSGVLQWIKTITHSTRPLFNTRIFWLGSNLYITGYNDNSQHIIIKLADTGGTDGTYGSYTIATVTTGYTTLTGSVANTTTGMTNTSRTVVTMNAIGATQSTPSYTSTVTNL